MVIKTKPRDYQKSIFETAKKAVEYIKKELDIIVPMKEFEPFRPIIAKELIGE